MRCMNAWIKFMWSLFLFVFFFVQRCSCFGINCQRCRQIQGMFKSRPWYSVQAKIVGIGERSWCTLQNYEFNTFSFFLSLFFFLHIMQNILARTHEWMRDRNKFCKRLNNCSWATLPVVRLILKRKHARFKNCPQFCCVGQERSLMRRKGLPQFASFA